MKPENRKPKTERNPKIEFRTPIGAFEFLALAFELPLNFGFRISGILQ